MFKEFLQKKGISESEYKQKTITEMATIDKEYNEFLIDSKIKDSAKSEDIKTLREEFNQLVNKAKSIENEKVSSAIDELNGEITELKQKTKNETNDSFIELATKQIKDIVSISKGRSNGKEVVIKANVTRASIANNTGSIRLSSIGQLGVKRRSLYDYFSKFPVSTGNHNGTISYIDWDEATIVRAANIVAEGAQFPQSTASFAEYTSKLQKIGDSLPVSEEFGEDEVLAASELENFIKVNVNTVIDNKIAVGAGGANDIEGLFTASPAYTAVASGIADANIKDLVRKMRTSIVKTRGSKYTPNFVAANSDVIDQYILKKDANNNYMFDMQTGTIAGLDIVEDNNLDDNTLVVGDGRFGRIYEMSGVTISEGHINDQFTGDLKTLKARTRLLFLIRNVDKTGFSKSTDIASDLVTLAS